MKKLLLYISFLFIANVIFGQVKVGPNGNIIATGSYPIGNSSDIKGGVHFFQTIAKRNALLPAFRDTGMLAYVGDSTKFYYLRNGIGDGNWTVWQGGGSGSSSGIDSITTSVSGDTTFMNVWVGGIKYPYYWEGDGSSGGDSSGIQSVGAGTNITVDNTDPSNPIVNAVLSSLTFEQSLINQGSTPFEEDHSIDGGGHNFFLEGLSSASIKTSQHGLSNIEYQAYSDSSSSGVFIVADSARSFLDDPASHNSVQIVSGFNDSTQSIYVEPHQIHLFPSDGGQKLIVKFTGVDSSDANPNNIAWFDDQNILQRGYLAGGGGGISRSELQDTAQAIRNDFPSGTGGVSQSVISDTLKNYANSGSLTTDNVLYSTPIALSVSNHLMTGTFALKSQSAYTLFGRGSGSGAPSFISSIDSNWVTGLHSEGYYNTKYLGGGGGSGNTKYVSQGYGIKVDSSGSLYTVKADSSVLATKTSSQTLTNKRWIPRVDSTTSSATPTINTDNVDIYKITAQTGNVTSFTTNLSGTPYGGEILEIQVTGTAARSLTWGAAFVSSSVTIPITTVSTKTLTVIFQYYKSSSYGNNVWLCVNYY